MNKTYSLLIADDEEMILQGMRDFIQRKTVCFGKIYCAQNGQEALDIVFKYHPDAMLLDIKMPVKSGLDVMKETIKAGRCPKTIILSGYEEFAYAQQALRLGAVDYLLKPCRSTEVLMKLEKAVKGEGLHDVLTGGETKHPIIKAAEEYIREHLADDISQSIVAEYAGVSSSYLSTLFAQEFGCGFVDYLNKLRIQYACDFMYDGRMKIYEIAPKVGFRDEKYFSKVFKKVTGKSPTEYRKNMDEVVFRVERG